MIALTVTGCQVALDVDDYRFGSGGSAAGPSPASDRGEAVAPGEPAAVEPCSGVDCTQPNRSGPGSGGLGVQGESMSRASASGDAGGSVAPNDGGSAECGGCRIGLACIPAGALSDTPCFVCDPARSNSRYSPAPGNACGDARSTTCDSPDTCDEGGTCRPNLAPDGTPCKGGLFCSVGDRCSAGACVPSASRECGPLELCDEGARACRCAGCSIGGICYADGAPEDAANPCRICDARRDAAAFSIAAFGTPCGEGPILCSGADSCDTSGRCVPNHVRAGEACGPTLLCPVPDRCDGAGTCVSAASQRPELCGNGIDDDCDLDVDEGCTGGPDVGGE